MWLMALLKEYVSAVLEGLMTSFHLVESVHLDGAVLYFNYFSQCYNVVMV